MRILNEDFARLNPDTTKLLLFLKYSSNKYRVSITKVDPDGIVRGVTRIFFTYNARNNMKESIQWPPQNYPCLGGETIENFSEDLWKILVLLNSQINYFPIHKLMELLCVLTTALLNHISKLQANTYP